VKIFYKFQLIDIELKTIFLFVFGIIFFDCVKHDSDSNSELVLPSSSLDLTNWKLTLPFDKEDKDGPESGVAAEISQPVLADYSNSPYYFYDKTKSGLVFRAHTGGAHTSGSGYPRSELREMTNEGKSQAKWNSEIGKHSMEIDQAITALPTQKKHVVAGQIHSTGDFDDVITCRLETNKLFLSHNGKKATVLTESYTLGKRFKIRFEVEKNQIKTYYNDSKQPVEIYDIAFPDAYFKAGCYTQSASWGKNDNHNADPKEFGEVIIFGLKVNHE
jgi:hypothetical protein